MSVITSGCLLTANISENVS